MSRMQWSIAIAVGALIFAAAVTAVVMMGGGREPAGKPVWPLTGQEAPDSDAVRDRVVSVKIGNTAEARPQDGVDQADVVYETLTEGGITRLNALFHSRSPERVGPVRSARLSDIHLVGQYNALFAYSGGNSLVLRSIEEADVEDVGASKAGDAYERSSEREAPHNLYTSLAALRQAAERRGYETAVTVPELTFGSAPEGGAAAGSLAVPFSNQAMVRWAWDAEAKGWTREINGETQMDEGSQRPDIVANVVVMFAETVESERPGTLEIDLEGSGKAVVFRDGKRFEGTWSAERSSPPKFETGDGEELALATGRTWVEVVPADFELE